MGYNLLIWGFPFYLIVVEVIFRSVSGLDTTSFIGASIATAGLSFMLPLTKPKGFRRFISPQAANVAEEKRVIVLSRADLSFIPWVWICIFLGFIIWIAAAYAGQNEPKTIIFFMPLHTAIGFSNYLLAAVLTGIKAQV